MLPIEPEEKRFELLSGLPGTGPAAVYFGDGRGRHNAQTVVRFFPSTGDSWVGNFQCGEMGLSDAIIHPDKRTVIVISQGKGYRVDPEAKSLLQFVGECVGVTATSPDAKLVVLADMATVWLVHEDDRVVRVDYVSYPEPWDIGFSNRYVYGIGASPEENGELLFAIERSTGALLGGMKPCSSTPRPNPSHLAFRDQRALLIFAVLALLTIVVVLVVRQ